MDLPFDKTKIFYPYVMNSLAMNHGIMDLFSRYLYTRINQLKAQGQHLETVIRLSMVDEKRMNFVERIYNEDLVPTLQLGDLNLKSSDGNPIKVVADDLSEEYGGNHPSIINQLAISNSMLIIAAYELSPKIEDITDELWNFFSHCRNACAHGGKFNIIRKGTRMFPARWRSLEITMEMNGSNIFANETVPGLLWPADPIYLLSDIEKKYL